ncbi:hypothetical protein [Caulobacter soli]|uniref:hypothetical protein n=1 Tax=Caulobacter soli TaxID=2708539 RepID=UPI0013EDDD5D|nr:hypothetical protein [Caulobacter soli]
MFDLPHHADLLTLPHILREAVENCEKADPDAGHKRQAAEHRDPACEIGDEHCFRMIVGGPEIQAPDTNDQEDGRHRNALGWAKVCFHWVLWCRKGSHTHVRVANRNYSLLYALGPAFLMSYRKLVNLIDHIELG